MLGILAERSSGPLRDYFLYGFHVLGGGAGVNDGGAFPRNFSGSEGRDVGDSIAFDGKGGFSFVTNGVPTVYGGTWKTEPGPGPNDLTHSGIFTNLTDVFEFRAVTDPAPDNDVGAGLLGGMTWIICLPGFAAKNLQCQAAASALFLTCAFQFKLPYATFTSKIDASGLMTNHIECITTCLTGCK